MPLGTALGSGLCGLEDGKKIAGSRKQQLLPPLLCESNSSLFLGTVLDIVHLARVQLLGVAL